MEGGLDFRKRHCLDVKGNNFTFVSKGNSTLVVATAITLRQCAMTMAMVMYCKEAGT